MKELYDLTAVSRIHTFSYSILLSSWNTDTNTDTNRDTDRDTDRNTDRNTDPYSYGWWIRVLFWEYFKTTRVE
jgi:hypothetical protein